MKTVLLFVVALAIFTVGLSGQEIISFDSRVYLFALEMWRHGLTWFPTTYGQLYPDYPVASTILIYGSALLFGGLNKLTAVLPSAVAAALTVVMTEKIGALEHKKLGFYAVFTLIGTLAFFKSARSIALDMYPTLITACCFYLVHSAVVKNQPGRVKWVYPLLLLSFIFRGPIGLVMPTGVVCVYYLLARNIRQFFVTGMVAFIILIVSTATLLLLAQHAGGDVFMQDVWRMEVMGRINNQFLPIYFYFTDSLISYALTYPFALAVMLGTLFISFTSSRYAAETRFLLQLCGWVLVIMLGMSVPGDKKVRYILPMAPALALLAASLWVAVPRQKYLAGLRVAAVFFYLFLPGLFSAATGYVWYAAAQSGLADTFSFLPIMVFFAVVQAVSLYFYLTDTDVPQRRDSWVIFAGTLCFVVANLLLIEPIELHLDRTRDFVKTVEQLRLQKHARLVFYREQPDGTPIKYLVNMSDETIPLFVADESGLKNVSGPAVFVTSEDYFQALSAGQQKKFHVMTKGRIGHVDVVVFGLDK